jgi:hypothetical protein
MRAASTACCITDTSRVVRAEAARLVEDLGDDFGMCDLRLRRAVEARELQALLRQVDADDALGSLQPAPGDSAEADHPGPEDHADRARLDLGAVHRRA